MQNFKDVIEKRKEFLSSLILVTQTLENDAYMEEILFEDEEEYIYDSLNIDDDVSNIQELLCFAYHRLNSTDSFEKNKDNEE